MRSLWGKLARAREVVILSFLFSLYDVSAVFFGGNADCLGFYY